MARALSAPKLSANEALELRLRVLPADVDLNGHMNNARYLTALDLARAAMFIRSGLTKLCMQRRLKPVAGGNVIHYRRALAPFQAYTLRLTLVAWDGYWSYQRFEFVRRGEICASGYTKLAVVGPRGLVLAREIHAALGHPVESPPIPADLAAWLTSDALLGVNARNYARDARRRVASAPP